ncbi:MAG: gliding motility-associated C-terminal domain-containing protein [Flavobacteriales bacterium]|nr:gliding motility-associated C-terminal domain-containing protein [Flavobacteriales bacterium]
MFLLWTLSGSAQDSLVITLSVEDATLTAPGSVDLNVDGAIGDVRILAIDSLPDSTSYGAQLTELDTTGFSLLGMPAVDPRSITYSSFLELHEPRLDSLPPGKYQLIAVDAAGNQASAVAEIGQPLAPAVIQGGVVPDEGAITKTAGNGWTNMRYTTKNILLDQQDGWLVFVAPDTQGKLAVGFRDQSIGAATSYQQMAFAWVLDGDSASTWEGGSFTGPKVPFAPDTKFSIEIKEGRVLFTRNGTIERDSKPSSFPEAMIADVAIYDNNGTIEGLKTDLPPDFTIQAQAGQLKPLWPKSGRVELQVEPDIGTYAFQWSDGPETKDRDGLKPGRYEVTVNSSYYGTQNTLAVDLGQLIVWNEAKGLGTEQQGLGTHLSFAPSGGRPVAATSRNCTAQPDKHWMKGRPVIGREDKNGCLLGFKDLVNQRTQFAWWVHPLNGELVARAIGPSGELKEFMLKAGSLVGIRFNEGAVHYEIDDQRMFSIPMQSEGVKLALMVTAWSEHVRIEDLATSVPLPLVVNTEQLVPGIAMTMQQPTNESSGLTSGTRSEVDLGTGPSEELYTLEVAAAADVRAGSITFRLDSGTVVEPAIVTSEGRYTLDPALYAVHDLNEVVFLDAPESRWANEEAPFHLLLDDQLLMTPNGDGAYDLFLIGGHRAEDAFLLTIKDRSGALLYQTNDPAQGWNGRFMNSGSMVPDGVYVYELELDGTPYQGQFMLKN